MCLLQDMLGVSVKDLNPGHKQLCSTFVERFNNCDDLAWF